jgi:hypothetical protein
LDDFQKSQYYKKFNQKFYLPKLEQEGNKLIIKRLNQNNKVNREKFHNRSNFSLGYGLGSSLSSSVIINNNNDI